MATTWLWLLPSFIKYDRQMSRNKLKSLKVTNSDQMAPKFFGCPRIGAMYQYVAPLFSRFPLLKGGLGLMFEVFPWASWRSNNGSKALPISSHSQILEPKPKFSSWILEGQVCSWDENFQGFASEKLWLISPAEFHPENQVIWITAIAMYIHNWLQPMRGGKARIYCGKVAFSLSTDWDKPDDSAGPV